MKTKTNIWSAISDIVNIHFLFISESILINTLLTKNNILGQNHGSANDFLEFVSFIFNIPSISVTKIISFCIFLLVIIGLLLNTKAMFENKESGISIVGPILGIIGNIDCFLGGTLRATSIVTFIVAAVFSSLQRPIRQHN